MKIWMGPKQKSSSKNIEWQENNTKWEEYEEKHVYRSYGRWFQWFDELWSRQTVCEYVEYNKLEVMIIPRYLKKIYSFKLRTILRKE